MKRLLNLTFVSATLVALPPCVLAEINFASPVHYSAGVWPKWVAVKDVNGDGKPDLICNNSGNFSLSILTNTGNGSFVTAPVPFVDGGVIKVAPGDLQGSGRIDLVCESYYDDGDISLLTNDGSGNFQLNSKLHLPYPPDAILATDLNGDGKTDLVRAGAGAIAFYTNNGSGTIPFGAPYAIGACNWSAPLAMIARDINADGNIDVIGAQGYGDKVSVITKDGSTNLTLVATNAVGDAPYFLVGADVNGDAKADLITANSGGDTLTILTNGGNAGFVLACTPAAGNYPYSLATCDLDGDGKVEVLCANPPEHSFSVLTNDGQGVFAQAKIFSVAAADWITVADVNGDGKTDVIVTDLNGNKLWVLINTTTFPAATSTPMLQIAYYANKAVVRWPSDSAGWSLQQSPDLLTLDWSPAGYGSQEIVDDGNYKSLTILKPTRKLYFRLTHP